ncbi:hypothetical protein JZ785_06105 [Alicyclobacillus curvatus]|jgi:hypothetical protein|nr:hypothetical protein JZ785_06105 [Alicyclobacillus curvatus]
MHRDKSATRDPYHKFAARLDDLILSIAVGCASMLVLVQTALQVPAIHRVFDEWRSGFVAANTPTILPSQRAVVELALAPDQTSPEVSILINGRKVVDFSKSVLVTISLQTSDYVTVQNDSAHVVYVTVNQSDPALLVPAPGQRVIVGPNSLANFPAVQFQPPAK